MKFYERRITFKFIITFCIFSIFCSNTFALIMGNYSEGSFCEGCKGTDQVNVYIIEGAGYFLNSYSEVLAILNAVEWSDLNGIDYNELQKVIGNAVYLMNNAKIAYSSLVNFAVVIPYSTDTLSLLKEFDYDGFMKEKNLNTGIFQVVKSFLYSGDVRGFYARILRNTGDILCKLYTIKADIDNNKLPDLQSLWSLNQAYVDTMLFGQYASETFYNLK